MRGLRRIAPLARANFRTCRLEYAITVVLTEGSAVESAIRTTRVCRE
jgi:hypothetical protein